MKLVLPSWTVRCVILAAIVIAVVCVYWPALRGPFAFDDTTLLQVLGDESFSQLNWTRPESRPLVGFSLLVERACFGSTPAVHRFGNLLIHSCAAWLLFDLVRLLRARATQAITSARSFPDTQSILEPQSFSPTGFAFVVAGLWAMHPIQTESVAYIVQRGESLMGCFYFAFLNAIARYYTSQRWWWGIIAIACFMAGLCSKTVMVTALAVAPLMDRAFFCNTWREVLKKAGWIYMPPVVLGVCAATLLVPGLLRGEANVGFGGYAPPVSLHLAAQAEMVWRYLALCLWPYELCIDYGLHPPESVISQGGWIVLTLGLIVTGAYFYAVRNQIIGFCLLAPLIVLSITSSVVPTADLFVEHRMYVSLAPIVAGLTLVVERTVNWIRAHDARPWLCVVSGSAMVILGARTYIRAADYASGVALWSGAVAVSPDNDRAIQNLMHAVGREREADVIIPILVDAVVDCEKGGLNPRVPLQRLGELLVRAQAFEQAEPFLRRAIEFDEQSKGHGYRDLHRNRDRAAAHVNLSLALAGRQDLNSAYANLVLAIEHFDQDANTRAMAGDMAKHLGHTQEARQHFLRALELQPAWPQVMADLALLEFALAQPNRETRP